MAYAALVSLAQTTDLILKYHQDSVSPQVKDQIISINEHVIFLQAFLEHFPDKANIWEGRMRMVAEAAEDIIEFFMWEQIHESCYASVDESSVGPSNSEFNFRPKRQYECWELKLITKEIESIAKKVMEIKNSITVKDVGLGDSTAPTSSSRAVPVHKQAMVGFDNNLKEIKSRLFGESSKLEVVPIVGMGGIGKTTLARNIYDDRLIVESFQIRAWATVSQDYSAQEIASCLLASMKGLGLKNDTLEVYQHLKGRRYLIVLDDIWSKNAWDDLKMMFPDDGNGSRIMLTTRLSDVASYPDSFSPIYGMHLTDEDHSWDLLRQKVFKQDPCPVDLEYVGKMIAKSCKGLPLAIVVISGILAVDQTKVAWQKIAKNVKSAVSAQDKQFDKILSLSYTHLPHHLRPCFLYMGGFPEDYEMRVSKLIRLWVAEGFLKPNGCNKSFEETAEVYLEDLVKRSLVLVTKRKFDGRIKSFGMHDLMREMCKRKTLEENFFLHVGALLPKGKKIPRRVSIIDSDPDFLRNTIYGSTIRTVICFGNNTQYRSFGYFRLLRILDLLYANGFLSDGRISYHIACRSIPAELFKLFYLRHLALDYPFRILGAISNLQNLQTLIIFSRGKYPRYEIPDFAKLPVEIWRMPQLRHLILCCHLLPFEQEATSALENLQTLSGALNFICSEKILKMIPNLKKLGIVYRTSRNKEYQLHNLIYLQQLENLKVEAECTFFYFGQKASPAFPRTVKKLTLSGIGLLRWEDMTIVGSLPYLAVLKLRKRACFRDTWKTIEGEFSQLIFLLIDKSNLKNWITKSSHFPTLKRLELCGCQYLSEIPDGIGEIPTLELIKLDRVEESLLESAKRIKEDQQSYGNNTLQICQVTELPDFVEATIDIAEGIRTMDVENPPMPDVGILPNAEVNFLASYNRVFFLLISV